MPSINSISAKNYKGFGSLDLTIKPLTVLLGSNSCGKSSIINLILMLTQSIDTQEELLSPLRINGLLVGLGEPDNIIRGRDEKNILEISISIDDSVNQQSITTHITKALTKYDNIGLRDFFILTYYRGSNFPNFAVRYKNFISELSTITGNPNSPVHMQEHHLSDIRNSGYREIISLGFRRDIPIKCTHMLIDQG